MIESRIEKRTTQLKKLEKYIDAWPADDESEDEATGHSPRTTWLNLAGTDDITRLATKESVEEERITKVAAVHLTNEIAHDDLRLPKADALRLVKEFNEQIASLKEYVVNLRKGPLQQGIQHLQAKQHEEAALSSPRAS